MASFSPFQIRAVRAAQFHPPRQTVNASAVGPDSRLGSVRQIACVFAMTHRIRIGLNACRDKLRNARHHFGLWLRSRSFFLATPGEGRGEGSARTRVVAQASHIHGALRARRVWRAARLARSFES